MLGDSLYLDNIEEYVQEEDKIDTNSHRQWEIPLKRKYKGQYYKPLVTYKWLSRSLEVPVNIAKQMLYAYVSQCHDKPDRTFTVTYLVTGVMKDGDSKEHQVRLVEEKDLEGTKKQFSQLLGTHIYSIQKTKLKESSSLYSADYDLCQGHIQDYSKWSTIDCPMSTVVKSTNVKEKASDANSNTSETHSSSNLPKLSHTEKSTGSSQGSKNVSSHWKKIGGHKQTRKKSNPAKGSMMSFFNKQPKNDIQKKPAEGKEKKTVQPAIEEETESKTMETQVETQPQTASSPLVSAKKPVGSAPRKQDRQQPSSKNKSKASGVFQGLDESDIDDDDTTSEEEKQSSRQSEQPKARHTKRKGISKDSKQKTSKGEQCKRKRIQELSSDEEDTSADKNKSHPGIENSGTTKQRKRVKRLVPKMYTNDDGEMVTERSWEMVSTDASDDDQDSGSSAERKKFKVESSSESGEQVKSEKKSPKKNVGTKQASLMSFFKK